MDRDFLAVAGPHFFELAAPQRFSGHKRGQKRHPQASRRCLASDLEVVDDEPRFDLYGLSPD
jgi:hypothetical protein